MENKLISVVMSNYNNSDFLKSAINSILKQSYKYLEVIIVDDCSTDNSLDILNEYKIKDKRINIIINKQNLGFTSSLNNAINHSNGYYIARMDADDICDTIRFEKQIAYMDENKLDVCGTNINMIDENGKEIGKRIYNQDVDKVIKIQSPLAHPTTLIKKELFDKYGVYNPDYKVAQDYDLWLKFYSKGAKFGIVPEYLFYYRQHPQMAKTSKTKLTLKNTIIIKLNAMKNYGIKFGFRGWLRLIAEMFLYLFPSRFILFLFYLKNK